MTDSESPGEETVDLPATAGDDQTDTSTSPAEAAPTVAESAEHTSEDFHVTLRSGTTIQVGSLLARARAGFEKRIAKSSTGQQVLKTYYPVRSSQDPRQLHMIIGRVRGVLVGPTAAYYRDGSPMIYVAYTRGGKRDETLLTWDEKKRPLTLEQYERGKRHGVRCLFKPCSLECQDGHVSVVQEWTHGRLVTTHVVNQDDQLVGYDMTRRAELAKHPELRDALRDLRAFDEELRDDERQLRGVVARLHRKQVQVAAMAEATRRRQVMAQAWMSTVNRLAQSARMSAGGCLRGR